MKRLASALTTSVLLLLAATGHAGAQTEKKPTATDAQSAQTKPAEKEPRAATRIRGSVVAEGRPVSDASIMVFPVNIAGNVQGAITSLLRPVTSDADGKFELTGLAAGAYSVTASAPGYVTVDEDAKAFYRPGDTATLTLVKGGVITGKVTNLSGDPVVGALVRAIKTREANNKPVQVRAGGIGSQLADSLEMVLGPYKTDDRGIYRIYGLSPGFYQVAAGGRSGQAFSLGGGNAYDGDAPTYYPSSTIDTAADVAVVAGQEATGIDIRYRENRGHSIGGTVSVASGPAPQAITVLLARANGVQEATAIIMSGRDHFGFDALLDGEYVVTALASPNFSLPTGGEGITASVSQPHRVTLKGADVSGVTLVVEPLASIAGRISVEPLLDAKQKAACKDLRPAPIEGTVITARGDRKETAVDPIAGPLGAFKDTTPNDKGEFLLSLLRPGVRRLDLQLPSEHLYVKAITLANADANTKPNDAARNGISLKSGDKIKGLSVEMSEGAARLSGKVVIGPENKPPETKMRVCLAPVEPEAADHVLRYFEAEVDADGGFALTNLAPGKYWVVGREVSESEQGEADHKPLAWDEATRTALRFEGDASKKVIELTQCQIMSDYRLKYIPLTKPSKPAAKNPAN